MIGRRACAIIPDGSDMLDRIRNGHGCQTRRLKRRSAQILQGRGQCDRRQLVAAPEGNLSNLGDAVWQDDARDGRILKGSSRKDRHRRGKGQDAASILESMAGRGIEEMAEISIV